MSFINWLLSWSDHKQYSLIRSLESVCTSATLWITKEKEEVFINKFFEKNEFYLVVHNEILRPLTMSERQKNGLRAGHLN